jgi:hypothetical protein
MTHESFEVEGVLMEELSDWATFGDKGEEVWPDFTQDSLLRALYASS